MSPMFGRNNNESVLGYRVFVRKTEPVYSLPKNGLKREVEANGCKSRWVPEDGVGQPLEAARQRVQELNREQHFIARLINPKAKLEIDII